MERFVTLADLDGQPFCVRFTDTAGNNCFDSMWHPVLGSAHAVLLCFAVDAEDSLEALQEKWLPLLWSGFNPDGDDVLWLDEFMWGEVYFAHPERYDSDVQVLTNIENWMRSVSARMSTISGTPT